MVNCMLVTSYALENLWGEALLNSCYISNRVLQKSIKITPYQFLKGRAPSLRFLKVWVV